MKSFSAMALRRSLDVARPPHDAAEERRLLAAARRGDRAALDAISQRVAGSLHRFGRGFCRDPHDAEDVMQDVFAALVRSIGRFRGDSSLSSWAYVVARNACARRRKRGARQVPVDPAGATLGAIADETAGPERMAERRQLRAALEAAIASLPDTLRDVLVLRDVEGLSAAEVAAHLDLGERAVKSRLHRARLALREKLAPHAARTAPRAPGCPDVARALSRFLEGDLDAGACERLEAHVSKCSGCSATCATLRTTVGQCVAWRHSPVPARLRTAVRSALREAIGASAPR